MTIATANGGRQRTSTDGLSQATRAAALVARGGGQERDRGAVEPFLRRSGLLGRAHLSQAAQQRRTWPPAGT